MIFLCLEVGLLLNNQLLPNNSVITWMEIGHGTGSLFCLTNKIDCCSSTPKSGSWHFPNGSAVTLSSMRNNAIVQEYGQSSILLQHHNGNPDISGIFHCEVLDDNNERQSLYIGIYLQQKKREHHF